MYVVLADSSRVQFTFLRGDSAVVGTFPRVLGSLAFRDVSRGFLNATGTLRVELDSATVPDTAATRSLAEILFPAARGREFASAELRVRQLYGRSFTKELVPGTVTPVTLIGQLVVHRMVLSRRFEGEITRVRSGYRITNATPLILSVRELGLTDELAAWPAASGGGIADPVIVTVDLRLVRRGPIDEPQERRSATEAG